MAGIPRFNAQIGAISVPSMKNFQQDQNEQIYKTIAGIADASANIAENMYVEQKTYEAEQKGGEATKETDLKSLPAPLTKAQQAYNNAAIASFYSDFSVDAERKINESAFKNQDNPEQFLIETDAYINGVSQNIPDNLKKQILKPVQMVRESKYDTLLKNNITRNKTASVETFQYNMWRKRKNANFISSDKDLDNYLADAEVTADSFVALGGKAEDAIKYLNDAYEDGLNRYLSNYYMKEKINPAEYKEFFKNVQLGKTGIKALDLMPPERRINIALKAFDDLNKAENTLAEKSFTITSNKEAESNLMFLSRRSTETETYINPAYDTGYVNENILDAAKNIENKTETYSVPEIMESVIYNAKNGFMDIDDAIELRNIGELGDKDFLDVCEIINSFQPKNRKLPEYQEAMNLIINSNPNVEDEYGQILATNSKQEFLLNKLDRFASTRPLTGEEITEYTNNIIKEANASFDEKDIYRNKFTKDRFYKTFSINYDDITSIANKYTIDGVMSKSKIKKAVMDKYNISGPKANTLLSYWLNVRKLENNNVK